MDPLNLLVILAAGSVACIAYFVTHLVTAGGTDSRIRDRLGLDAPPIAAAVKEPFSVLGALQQVGLACAKPFMPATREKQSALRKALALAGIYHPTAVRLITGCKVIFLTLGLLLGYGLGSVWGDVLLGVSFGGLVGYALPVLWLKTQVKKNQVELTYALPDALDLLVVCVEAGLTIDAAVQRVGQELAIAHPRLSRELAITHMETRVGIARSEAMKNLAGRTQNAAIQSLVAMLVQADRFGTSIATSLRIHSESLRGKRQHQAEEMAAKATVKMTFPLVLFIFPATFIVLAGPTILNLMNSAFFK
jgi:tight adherence protein C